MLHYNSTVNIAFFCEENNQIDSLCKVFWLQYQNEDNFDALTEKFLSLKVDYCERINDLYKIVVSDGKRSEMLIEPKFRCFTTFSEAIFVGNLIQIISPINQSLGVAMIAEYSCKDSGSIEYYLRS